MVLVVLFLDVCMFELLECVGLLVVPLLPLGVPFVLRCARSLVLVESVVLIVLPELLVNILVLLQVPLLVVPLLTGAIPLSLVSRWRVLLPLLLKDPVIEAIAIPVSNVILKVLLMSLLVVVV